MSGDTIKFKDWETGKEKEYSLKWGEHESTFVCPLDDSSLVSYAESPAPNSNYLSCPNCETKYGEITGNTQENINNFAKQHFLKIPEKLRMLEVRKKGLEKMWGVAKSKGLFQETPSRAKKPILVSDSFDLIGKITKKVTGK